MQYKSMVLGLLEQRPGVYRQLRRQKILLTAMEFYAGELKTLHEGWKQHLTESNPDSDESRIASEARELALQDLESLLPGDSSPPDEDRPTLDDLMTFLSAHTPPA